MALDDVAVVVGCPNRGAAGAGVDEDAVLLDEAVELNKGTEAGATPNKEGAVEAGVLVDVVGSLFGVKENGEASADGVAPPRLKENVAALLATDAGGASEVSPLAFGWPNENGAGLRVEAGGFDGRIDLEAAWKLDPVAGTGVTDGSTTDGGGTKDTVKLDVVDGVGMLNEGKTPLPNLGVTTACVGATDEPDGMVAGAAPFGAETAVVAARLGAGATGMVSADGASRAAGTATVLAEEEGEEEEEEGIDEASEAKEVTFFIVPAVGTTIGVIEGAVERVVDGAVDGAVEGRTAGTALGAMEGVIAGATEGAVKGTAGEVILGITEGAKRG